MQVFEDANPLILHCELEELRKKLEKFVVGGYLSGIGNYSLSWSTW